MEKNQDDFLKQLLQTFKIEADEHLQAINNLLIEVEKQKEGPSDAGIIEEIFRETHSLKGGARSVNYVTIESLCSSMENIFSVWKNKQFFYSKELFDDFHRGLSLLRRFFDSDFNDKLCEIDIVETTQVIKAFEIPELPAKEASVPAATQKAETASPIPEEIQEENLHTPSKQPVPEKQPVPQPDVTAPKLKDEIIRVNVNRLDSLLNHSEELITFKLRFEQHYNELEALQNEIGRLLKYMKHVQPVMNAVENNQLETSCNNVLTQLIGTNTRYFSDLRSMQKEVDSLIHDVRATMLVPCSRLFDIYPKMVRDIASDQGKEVELTIKGDNIEIDRRILDILRDPIMHIIRNAVDHGIEHVEERKKKKKTVLAHIGISVNMALGNKIEIKIEDDGKGIDTRKIKSVLVKDKILSGDEAGNLTDVELMNSIFHSGLTTAEIITDISGRGLGLAIAYSAVDGVGGKIQVESEFGKGTIFTIIVPVSTSTSRGTFVECGGMQYIIPSLNINCSLRIKRNEIKTIESKLAFYFQGRTISLIFLSDVLNFTRTFFEDDAFLNILIIEDKGKEIGFVVDRILYEQEILVKPLGELLKRVRFVKGVTIVGTGKVVPILNPSDLFIASVNNRSTEMESTGGMEKIQKSVLIAEDSITSRMLLKDILESAGYKVQTSNDGMEALSYLKEKEFDALVSDVEMPRMNGFELTRTIRSEEQFADLPVILVTALKTREDRERGLEAGANAYIEKGGFNPGNLLNTLDKLI